MTFFSFLTQDLSYYCCIELQGEEVELLSSLSQLTSKEAGENTIQKKTHLVFFSDGGEGFSQSEVSSLDRTTGATCEWCVFSRSYVRCSTVSLRAKTGQCSGVQSRTVPDATPGPCHIPLETPCTGLNPQAAVDLGSSHY